MTLELLFAFLTLTALEIVLGIDNIIFISLLSGKLPSEQRELARRLGLFFAMFTRILLLLSISWLVSLTEPLLSFRELTLSGRDLVLIIGGLFLIGKSTSELHLQVTHEQHQASIETKKAPYFWSTILQIAILDIVFSLDTVITAVGMVNNMIVMVSAIVASMFVMLMLSTKISNFIDKRPTIKVLALSFLILIGVALIADGFALHIPKGYIYFAMVYALGIELINGKVR